MKLAVGKENITMKIEITEPTKQEKKPTKFPYLAKDGAGDTYLILSENKIMVLVCSPSEYIGQILNINRLSSEWTILPPGTKVTFTQE